MPEDEGAAERWRLTIDSAPVGIALASLDGRFLMVNAALCRILGYSADELTRRGFDDLTHPADLDRHLDLRRQLVEGRIPRFRMRKRYLQADGRIVWADLFVSLARDEEGQPLHLITYVDDVTEQVRAAERIERMNQDLLQQRERLQRSNDDLEAFAALASHDLQAPLGTIRGYLELLSGEYGDRLDEQGHTWLNRASEASERMSRLLTTLLEFSRAAGSGEPLLETVDLGALVGEVTADLGELVSSTRASVRFTGPVTDIVCDRSRLHQVLQNLVQNAVKYRHPERDPVIEVGVVERDDHWQVTVADNGVGVPDEDRERVFTMFQQSDPEHAGFGIGLAVSRRIVERHGGRIWVEDNPAGGSRFRFTIRRAAA